LEGEYEGVISSVKVVKATFQSSKIPFEYFSYSEMLLYEMVTYRLPTI